MDNERKTFAATVLGNSLQKSKEQGTPSVVVRLRTHYNTATPDNPEQMNLIGNLWLTYKTMERTIKTLQDVFGWKGHEITDFNVPILAGKKCDIVCELETYQGDERWSIVFFNRPGGFKKLDAAELTDLVAEVQPMVNKLVGEPIDIRREETDTVIEEETQDLERTHEEIDAAADEPLPF